VSMDGSALPENDLILRQAGVAPGGAVAAALAGRVDILAMTRKSEAASLRPADPGGLSHGERAALAVRIARLHGDGALAAHYAGLMAQAGAAGDIAALADPGCKGANPRHAALVVYVDLASKAPKDAATGDIEALRAAGISDADIVRLSELTAFLAYQIRVIAGLKLMQATA